MIIKRSNKRTFKVGTAIAMTVLTLMLTACNKSDTDIKNAASITKIDSSEVETAREKSKLDYLNVSLIGGSGKATVKSKASVKEADGKLLVTIEWSSPNYDYMIVNGEKYLPINNSGNSVFEIPIDEPECEINVTADTVAMSKPHEIEYTLVFSLDEISDSNIDAEADSFDNKSEIATEIKEWIDAHILTSKMERKFAEKFAVSYYDDSYCIVTINGSDFYLISKSENDIPSDLPDSITIIKAPIENVYVVSSASYNYFKTLDALSSISFTSLKENEIEDDEINKMIEDGRIKYAGKYSTPDYELLVSDGVKLVVENTMILHSPDVLNQLKKLNINTIVDYSSHESTPLGRMEWIKLYGLLTGNEKLAETIFSEKEEALSSANEMTGKKVAYFYITNSGAVVVRRNQDYISKLIELSGGEYVFSGLSDYDGTGTMTIQKEAFFKAVKDCDYLIYNTTISGAPSGMDELIAKCEVLKNTKAYKEGNIYCTTDNIYVKVMELPEIAEDINNVVTNSGDLNYLYKLQ